VLGAPLNESESGFGDIANIAVHLNIMKFLKKFRIEEEIVKEQF
jgi:hypothetical protein